MYASEIDTPKYLPASSLTNPKFGIHTNGIVPDILPILFWWGSIGKYLWCNSGLGFTRTTATTLQAEKEDVRTSFMFIWNANLAHWFLQSFVLYVHYVCWMRKKNSSIDVQSSRSCNLHGPISKQWLGASSSYFTSSRAFSKNSNHSGGKICVWSVPLLNSLQHRLKGLCNMNYETKYLFLPFEQLILHDQLR